MMKCDLKNRMVVEVRNGQRYLVVDDLLLATDGRGFMTLDSYTDDLLLDESSTEPRYEKMYRKYDIMKIYDKTTQWSYLKENEDLLWHRNEKQVEMTFDEIKEKLGISNLKICGLSPCDIILKSNTKRCR